MRWYTGDATYDTLLACALGFAVAVFAISWFLPSPYGHFSSTRLDVNLGPSFAVTGLQPSHGPWTGGTRTTVAGQGFSSYIQVWIGSTEFSIGCSQLQFSTARPQWRIVPGSTNPS